VVVVFFAGVVVVATGLAAVATGLAVVAVGIGLRGAAGAFAVIAVDLTAALFTAAAGVPGDGFAITVRCCWAETADPAGTAPPAGTADPAGTAAPVGVVPTKPVPGTLVDPFAAVEFDGNATGLLLLTLLGARLGKFML
jgi:hypothetical protein